MNETLYWVCADAITLAAQLRSAVDLPSPDVFRQRIANLFDGMRQRAAAAQIQTGDINEALFAIAAFMDEQILQSPWPGRQQWTALPLQRVYFNTVAAGEEFFKRMQALESDPSRAHVLEIYYLCLALGFQGEYQISKGSELGALQIQVAQAVSRSLPNSDRISPNGYPERGFKAYSRAGLPVAAISLGLFGLAILVFLVLKLTASSAASSAAESMGHQASMTLLTKRGIA